MHNGSGKFQCTAGTAKLNYLKVSLQSRSIKII